MNITDYIFKKKFLPKEFCTDVVEKIKNKEWDKHQWYNYNENSTQSEQTKELDVLSIMEELQEKFTPYLLKATEEYNNKFAILDNIKTNRLVSKISPIRFNRYSEGTVMRKHYDHIHSIFDGEHKGIPVLSYVGNLNEDYEGGDLIICNQSMSLKTGDICIFPSCFLYPHEVTEVKKGTRYSFVSWAF
jgi:predicted 2-oxoglutarate/Fe(II)-dependent dioxygenase YbiX